MTYDHPPLPPGCPFFQEIPWNGHNVMAFKVGPVEVLMLPGMSMVQSIDTRLGKQMRPVIAIVAAFYWLGECKKVVEELKTLPAPTFNHTREDGPYEPCLQCSERLKPRMMLYAKATAATSNSDLWSEWGSK
jgi:hypothetical protein